jgi:hypothetical protein
MGLIWRGKSKICLLFLCSLSLLRTWLSPRYWVQVQLLLQKPALEKRLMNPLMSSLSLLMLITAEIYLPSSITPYSRVNNAACRAGVLRETRDHLSEGIRWPRANLWINIKKPTGKVFRPTSPLNPRNVNYSTSQWLLVRENKKRQPDNKSRFSYLTTKWAPWKRWRRSWRRKLQAVRNSLTKKRWLLC